MNVAVVLAGRGGIRTFAERTAAALERLDGVDVRRIVVEPADLTDRRTVAATVERVADDAASGDAAVLQWSPNLLSFAPAGTPATLERAIAGRTRLVVVTHDVYDPPGGAVGRIAGRLLVATVGRRLGGRRLEQLGGVARIGRTAGTVVAISTAEHRRLVAAGIDAALLPHPVEIDDQVTPSSARRALGWDDRPRIVLPGYLHRRKGFDLAAEVIARVRQTTPDAVLVAAGGPAPGAGDWVDEITTANADLVAAGAIVKTGERDALEYEQLVAAADVVIAPYRRIAASGSLLDAAKYRRPIVMPAGDFAAELTADGADVAVVSGWDPVAWAAAVDDVLSRRDTGADDESSALVERRSWAGFATALGEVMRTR